ncbi:MAG: DNA mismatch repair endonuclease MutL [Spirochaetes bacterium]|nr:DNA mismatch repair endonuclease MutL [Spirochaetota bacterium]
MNRVKILPEKMWTKIRAGEIVEDHSSIIRELIDNSYDALAKNIKIYLYKSGIEKIIIIDDGIGIDKDDLPLVYLNHSTSKIEKEEDLLAIKTLGFRGEALFAISNVSKLIIKSKTNYQDSGYFIQIEGGKKITFSPIAMNLGTQVEVSDLFFNTPARKKFLPPQSIIYKKIKDIINKKALSCYETNFYLFNNNKNVFSYTKNNFFERIKEIYGELIYSNLYMIEIKKEENSYSTNYFKYIDGKEEELNYYNFSDKIPSLYEFLEKFQINKIYLCFSSKDFYSKYSSTIVNIINKRPVYFDLLEKKIRSFYYSFLPRGFYPYFFFYTELSPNLIDQNVDPTKSRIKIKDEKIFCENIEKILIYLINKEIGSQITNSFIKSDDDGQLLCNYLNYDESTFDKTYVDDNIKTEYFSSIVHDIEESDFYLQSINYKNNLNSEVTLDEINLSNNTKFENLTIYDNFFGKYIGSIFDTYLIFEKIDPNNKKENKIYLIDFHAAYEACNFKMLKEKKIRRRVLLFPENIKLPENILNNLENFKDKTNILFNKIEFLNKIGFSFERVSKNILQLIEVPDIIEPANIPSILIDIQDFLENSDYIKNNNGKSQDQNLFEIIKSKILAQIACKNSPKAFERLTLIDINNLLNLIKNSNYPTSCPHGRPVFIELTKQFFDKKFLRE